MLSHVNLFAFVLKMAEMPYVLFRLSLPKFAFFKIINQNFSFFNSSVMDLDPYSEFRDPIGFGRGR